MTREDISNAVGNISTRHIAEASPVKAAAKKVRLVRLAAFAACLCLAVIGAVTLLNHDTPNPSNIDPPAVTGGTRDDSIDPANDPIASNEPGALGERLNIYENTPIGIDNSFMEEMTDALVRAGWGETEYTIHGADSFIMKGTAFSTIDRTSEYGMSESERVESAKTFLKDSGLEELLSETGTDCELEADSSDGLTVFCYLLCEKERTGAYLRFIFEDNYLLGELQAFVFISERIDSLEKLSFADALKQAFRVDSADEEEPVPVDVSGYTIKNEKVVYVNGLPYYKFDGLGIGTRDLIAGYALAVDIKTSSFSDELTEKHLSAFVS
jgi:hypothetical protein